MSDKESQNPENQEPDKPAPTEKLRLVLSRYVRRLEGIKQAEEIVMPLIAAESKKADSIFSTFLEKNGIKEEKSDGKHTFTMPIDKSHHFGQILRRGEALDSAFFQTPRALMVALVSSYDAFLGDLLRATFYIKPEIIESSSRTMTFSELISFGSVEAAREYLIEKEVESVIRDSHARHFEWMENRFGLPLRKGLSSWPLFIEITERRNLFVHTNGVVSSQYLDVCRQHQIDVSKHKVGDQLVVNARYFEAAFECLYEIGVKLCHVLWRKLEPSDLKRADEALNSICFDLLTSGHFKLAEGLLEFSTSILKKHDSNLSRRIFVVNLAIANKWQGKNDKASAIIAGEDWSDCGDRFNLAVAVLSDDFDEAERIMRSLGKEAKGVGRSGYEGWPLFKEFRKSAQFLSAFKDIYGEEFEVQTSATTESKERTAAIDAANPERA